MWRGPELDPATPPQLPIAGQATYSGLAGGLYAQEHGSAWGDAERTIATEEYEGTFTITVDVSDSTMRGCIGCEGDILTRRANFGVFLGEHVRELLAAPTDYELDFGSTPFNADGIFGHAEAEVRHPERTVTESSGFWGGQFSNMPDRTGSPRLVTGSVAANFRMPTAAAGPSSERLTPRASPSGSRRGVGSREAYRRRIKTGQRRIECNVGATI